jgi:putative peptidoglycan lipid II flippase
MTKSKDLKTSESEVSAPAKRESVFLNAAAMAGGTMMSRILGLVRDMTFAAVFDRTITDAWGVAFRIPNLFRRLLGEGSLAVSFVPVFVECKNSQDPMRAKNLVNCFYAMLLILLSVLTLLGIAYSEKIIALIIQDHFDSVAGKFALTVRMSQIMFGFIFLMSTFAFFMGILNSLGEFRLPAIAPTFFNVAMISSNFVPRQWQVVEGDALAWGVILGGVLQTGILIPALIKKGYFPKPKWDFKNADSWRVWKGMLPGLVGTGLLQITTIINTYFAASLGEGSNTYIYLADRLLELPLSLVAVSLGTALLPTLSQEQSLGRKQSMIDTLSFYLRVNLYVCLPAAVGLMILSYPMTKILFGRGEFDENDVLITQSVIMIYSLTLIGASSVRVLVPGFYAIKNTWLPSVVSVVCLVFHVLMAPILMQHFQIRGLVSSTMLSGFLNLILIYSCYQVMVGKLQTKLIFKRLCLMMVPLSSVIFICILGQHLFAFFQALLMQLIALMGTIVLAGYLYFKISKVMELEEYKTSFEKLLPLLRKI